MPTQPSKELQTFPNPKPQRRYTVKFETSEFTCVCPLTGQPDFASLEITYIPDLLCVELKSLKQYLWHFRNEGHFHEAVTNSICDDLAKCLSPHSLTIVGNFNLRGGISTVVTAHFEK